MSDVEAQTAMSTHASSWRPAAYLSAAGFADACPVPLACPPAAPTTRAER